MFSSTKLRLFVIASLILAPAVSAWADAPGLSREERERRWRERQAQMRPIPARPAPAVAAHIVPVADGKTLRLVFRLPTPGEYAMRLFGPDSDEKMLSEGRGESDDLNGVTLTVNADFTPPRDRETRWLLAADFTLRETERTGFGPKLTGKTFDQRLTRRFIARWEGERVHILDEQGRALPQDGTMLPLQPEPPRRPRP